MDNLEAQVKLLQELVAKEPERPGLWYYSPAELYRVPGTFAGLHNLGATCYINSIIQQFFMIPSFRAELLSVTVPSTGSSLKSNEDCALFQLQTLFAHLQDSFKKEYDPTPFIASCKGVDGRPLDPHIQMDVDEFFNVLFDRLENICKGSSHDLLFKKYFGGKLSQQIKSKECSHVSEREENFFALQCGVKGISDIESSLRTYVEGEVLDGENKYHCSQCNRKVDAIKRTCIKQLPSHLIMHLKRFDFDFNTMRRLKINENFSFPLKLNMEPYTDAFISRQEDPSKGNASMDVDSSNCIYELGGVLIHQGTAESGHYYSLIKRRGSEKGKEEEWYQFNDSLITEIKVEDLSQMAFGGPSTPSGKAKLKNFNAYILVYDRVISTSDTNETLQLSVNEKIKSNINQSNLKFAWDMKFFDTIMAKLVLSSVQLNSCIPNLLQSPEIETFKHESALKLAVEYFTKAYIRLKDLSDLQSWQVTISNMICVNAKMASWTINYFIGLGQELLRDLLLSCSNKDVRASIVHVIVTGINCLVLEKSEEYCQLVFKFIDQLVLLLPLQRLYWRTFDDYWRLLALIGNLQPNICHYMMNRQALLRAVDLVLANRSTLFGDKPVKIGDRRSVPDYDGISIFIWVCFEHSDIYSSIMKIIEPSFSSSVSDKYLIPEETSRAIMLIENESMVFFVNLFWNAGKSNAVARIIELVTQKLAGKLDQVLFSLYREAIEASGQSARACFDLLKEKLDKHADIVKQNIDIHETNSAMSWLHSFITVLKSADVPHDVMLHAWKCFDQWSGTYTFVRDFLQDNYEIWAFDFLVSRSPEICKEVESLVHKLLLHPNTSNMKSASVVSLSKTKVIVLDKSEEELSDTQIQNKKRVDSYCKFYLSKLERAVKLAQIVRKKEVFHLDAYARVLKECLDGKSVGEQLVSHVESIALICAYRSRLQIEFDLSSKEFTLILCEIIEYDKTQVSILIRNAEILEWLAADFETINSGNESAVQFNIERLPKLYRILEVCCDRSQLLCEKLAHSSWIQWTIENIALDKTYVRYLMSYFSMLSIVAIFSRKLRFVSIRLLQNSQKHSELEAINLTYAVCIGKPEIDLLDQLQLYTICNYFISAAGKQMSNGAMLKCIIILERVAFICYDCIVKQMHSQTLKMFTTLLSSTDNVWKTPFIHLLVRSLFNCLNWNLNSLVTQAACTLIRTLCSLNNPKITESLASVSALSLSKLVQISLGSLDSESKERFIAQQANLRFSPLAPLNRPTTPPVAVDNELSIIPCGIVIIDGWLSKLEQKLQQERFTEYYQPFISMLSALSCRLLESGENPSFAVECVYLLVAYCGECNIDIVGPSHMIVMFNHSAFLQFVMQTDESPSPPLVNMTKALISNCCNKTWDTKVSQSTLLAFGALLSKLKEFGVTKTLSAIQDDILAFMRTCPDFESKKRFLPLYVYMKQIALAVGGLQTEMETDQMRSELSKMDISVMFKQLQQFQTDLQKIQPILPDHPFKCDENYDTDVSDSPFTAQFDESDQERPPTNDQSPLDAPSDILVLEDEDETSESAALRYPSVNDDMRNVFN